MSEAEHGLHAGQDTYCENRTVTQYIHQHHMMCNARTECHVHILSLNGYRRVRQYAVSGVASLHPKLLLLLALSRARLVCARHSTSLQLLHVKVLLHKRPRHPTRHDLVPAHGRRAEHFRAVAEQCKGGQLL